jgi:hypothetical protein
MIKEFDRVVLPGVIQYSEGAARASFPDSFGRGVRGEGSLEDHGFSETHVGIHTFGFIPRRKGEQTEVLRERREA